MIQSQPVVGNYAFQNSDNMLSQTNSALDNEFSRLLAVLQELEQALQTQEGAQGQQPVEMPQAQDAVQTAQVPQTQQFPELPQSWRPTQAQQGQQTGEDRQTLPNQQAGPSQQAGQGLGQGLGLGLGQDPQAEQGQTVDISGQDKAITISNTSSKPMAIYHTGGDGGATTKVATIPPGGSFTGTVGKGTSGAFTKGDADGNFTPNSGRIEYSVTQDGKVSANLDSELGVDAMSLEAGGFLKQVGDPTADAPATLIDPSTGRLKEPKTNPDVQAYLQSIPGYSDNSYTVYNEDSRTNVMEAAMLDTDHVNASFG